MKRLQKNFSRDLQNTLSLLGQSDIGSPMASYQPFTRNNNSTKKSPIQIITTTQTQNSSKPKPKPKTKNRTKQNSPKPTTKRKVPIKKHQKKLPDQISMNSILENPISSDDPNIKKMFTLFHLERTYRQKKVEKMYNFYFYLWFKKLTRKLLKIRVDQQKSQSMIQSSSIIHVSTPTADQLTQTELLSESDSDIFNFSNDDVQDFPKAVDSLSDTQLIHKVITGSSIYNNDIEEDYDDSFLRQRRNNQRTNKEQEQTLNSFISWKSEQLSNNVIDETCDLASTIIEKSISSEDSCKSGETLESYISRSISSKVKNDSNQISQYYNDGYGLGNDFLNQNSPGSSESNDNSYEDDYNSTNIYNEYPSNDNNFIVKDEIYSKASSFQYNSLDEPQNTRIDRNRPPPVDLNAKTLPVPPISESKPPDIVVKPRPESELRKYLRNIITENYFESIKLAQIRKDITLPLLVIPPNVQKPWQFTNEYCELIIDVVNEFAQITDLKNYTTEEFLDYLYNFFEKSHNQRNKTIFAELETLYQKKFDDFLLTYSIDISDSLLQYQLDSVLGI